MYFCNETLSRKKAARDNCKPSPKESVKIWPKTPIFLESRLLFCIHRVTRTKKNFGGKFKNYYPEVIWTMKPHCSGLWKKKSELKQKLVNCKEIKSMSNTGKGSDDKNSVFQNFQSGKMRSRWKKTNAMNVLTIK